MLQLPSRYQGTSSIADHLTRRTVGNVPPGIQILDVGAGRQPTLPPEARAGTEYIGLDISEEELSLAGPGSYTKTVASDVLEPVPELANRFDLVFCSNTLEHVPHVPLALARLQTYLHPEGRLLALLAGRYAAHSIANRVVAHRFAARIVERSTGRAADTVFPARYDQCWYSALCSALESWSTYSVTPLYLDANYFAFSGLAQRLYLRYEGWAMKHPNLASHYIIDAIR